MTFDSRQDYYAWLDKHLIIPEGYRFFVDSLAFNSSERPSTEPYRMNVGYIHSDVPDTQAAVVTTTNRFPGAPVLLARERQGAGRLRALLINNKIANVAVETGLADARLLAEEVARAFSVQPEEVLSVSTGIIGWRLPVPEMVAVLPRLPQRPCSARDVAEAIMTTDRYPKLAWACAEAGSPRVLGIAKGAGMVEPNLATMLAFFLTDALVPAAMLDRVLRRVVNRSFNCLSIDSDQSTSDMVVALANGGCRSELDEIELERMFQSTADSLALEIVRNGEGTAHVVEVIVRGCRDYALARDLGRHVVNSPLVKTAISGNDPNVGRILAALGNGLARYDRNSLLDPSRLSMTMCGRDVYRDGAFVLDETTEKLLAEAFSVASMNPTIQGYPQDRGTVTIVLDFHGPVGEDVRVLGSDLSHEYVRVNADYRT